jgi:flavorubredoxin
MDTSEMAEGLRAFTTYVAPIDLTFHQYLLDGSQPLLVHTGSAHVARELVPRLREALGGRELAWVFVSHFESDECGGLAEVLAAFPGARPVCSAVCARQLAGFGITEGAVAKAPGERLHLGDEAELEFVSYPSEPHLWEGLLAFETKRGILFSSDLMMAFGPLVQPRAGVGWESAVAMISAEQIPDPAALQTMQETLLGMPVRFVAPGHGPGLAVRRDS